MAEGSPRQKRCKQGPGRGRPAGIEFDYVDRELDVMRTSSFRSHSTTEARRSARWFEIFFYVGLTALR